MAMSSLHGWCREEKKIMRRTLVGSLAMAVAWGLAGVAGADVWDTGTPNDNTTATQNELVHGSSQTHDLAGQPGPNIDQDLYKIGVPPYTSWEVITDAVGADVGFGMSLVRTSSNGSTVIQASDPVSTLGFTRSLRWMNTTASPITAEFVKASPTGCGSNCTLNDVYQIRSFETTYAIPRFNSTSSQSTVLVIQNTAAYEVGGTVYFWNNAGALLHAVALAPTGFTKIPAKATLVLFPADFTQLQNQSGSVTIANDGRFGDLRGKAVSFEPTTGYSFDTPMTGRP
jgi:hypothetical protein